MAHAAPSMEWWSMFTCPRRRGLKRHGLRCCPRMTVVVVGVATLLALLAHFLGHAQPGQSCAPALHRPQHLGQASIGGIVRSHAMAPDEAGPWLLPPIVPPIMRVVVPLVTEDDRAYGTTQRIPGEMDVFVDAWVERAPPPSLWPDTNVPCLVMVSRKNPNAAPDPTKLDLPGIRVRALLPVFTAAPATFSFDNGTSYVTGREVVDIPKALSSRIRNCRLRCTHNGVENAGRDNLSSWTYVLRFCSARLPVNTSVELEVTYTHRKTLNGTAPTLLAYQHQFWAMAFTADTSAKARKSLALRVGDVLATEHTKTATANVIHASSNPASVALATMFRGDADFLLSWTEHYRSLGVDKFYLYFNGPIYIDAGRTTVHPELTATGMLEVLAQPDVQLVDWTPPFFDAWDIRFGQAPAMQSSWNRFRAQHQWMLYFDMDEYLLLPPGDTIQSFLGRQDAACAVFQFPSALGILDCSDPNAALSPVPRLQALRRCKVTRTPEFITVRRQKMALRTSSRVAVINIHQATSEDVNELTCAVDPVTAHFIHLLNLAREPNAPPIAHKSIMPNETEALRREANVTVMGWFSGDAR